MRVLHYLECIDRAQGGVVTAAMDMCEALVGYGVDVELVTGIDVDAPDDWRSGATPHMNLTVDPAYVCRYRPPEDLRKKIRPLLAQADALHLHGVWNPLHRFLAAEAVHLNKPYVVTLHGMLDYWSMDHGGPLKRLKKRAYLKLHGEKILKRASAVQCTAPLEADAARDYVPGINTVVLPYIFKPEGMLEVDRGDIPADPAKPRLLFLSRIHFKKRPDLMIELAAELPEVEVVLAGPVEPAEYKPELLALADRLSVTDRVTWAGMLRGADKTRAFAESDVFVLPTSQENFGIVLAEAMAAEMPVVTTRGTAIWKDLESAGAWIVEQDAKDLARAVREILDNRESTRRRSREGRAWVKQALLADALAPQYTELYRSLCHGSEANVDVAEGGGE